jgi:hypothetical protein
MKYVDQRKERIELLEELLNNGAGINPLPTLSQVLLCPKVVVPSVTEKEKTSTKTAHALSTESVFYL